MGRIQEQPQQNQAEYELQPQEYQYEPTQDSTIALDHEQYQEQEYPQHPSDAVGGEPQPQQQFQPPPQYGNPQPNPDYMPQRTQQMNAMNANQLVPAVPFPPQVHVFPHGSTQPHGFSAGSPAPPPPVPPFPPASPYKPQPYDVNAGYWTSGLFDCMNDPTNALITALFPCVTFGQVAEIVDRGHTTCGTSGLLYGLVGFLTALPCIYSCTYRTKMRSLYGLYESPAPDWLVHCLCECCALCQEYRELQARGYDPSIGWMGNQIKGQNIHMQHGAMVPPTGQSMMG